MRDPGDQTDTLAGADATHPQTDSDPLMPGVQPRMLGRRYLLEERIASGGMAAVWRAHDEVLARTVAVKVLHDHLAQDAAFRERFRREAVTAARLAHPNIVSLYDTGTDGDQVYLVMEHVDGPTLRDVIADAGKLEVGEACAIGERVARALDYAHARGLVHRDVKPANILIGENRTVKVADFGIAKADHDTDLTRTGMVLGTAAYVAPEQVLAKPLDGKADQYALGCVLYEAMTGQRPFKGESPVATAAQRLEDDPPPLRSLRADIPQELEQIIGRCLAREKNERFPSCGQLADALSAFTQPDDVEAIGLLTERIERTTALPLPRPPVTRSPLPRPPVSRAVRDEAQLFFRSESYWLVPVLALLVLAGTLVGVGLATGVLETRGGLLPHLARDITGAGEVVPLSIRETSDFDPLGDQGENPGALGNLTDGAENTDWRTEGYDTPALGGLKEGVGFWIDLGASQAVRSVHLHTTTPGITYELRVANQPSTSIEGWRTVATVADAPAGEKVVTLDQPAQARYVLVWIRGNLQRRQDNRFFAGFSEITVEGTPPR
jgi:eukaryotic-like serine/threonine-protein kinase